MRRNILLLVAVVLIWTSAFGEVFLGYAPGACIKAKKGKAVDVPIFLEFQGNSTVLIERFGDGKKQYCDVTSSVLGTGVWTVICSWSNSEVSIDVQSPPSFVNVVLGWQEDWGGNYTLRVCVNNDCGEIQIEVESGEQGTSSGQSEPSGGTSENTSNTSNNSSSGASLLGGGGSSSSHSSPFQQLIKHPPSAPSKPQVWNGYVEEESASGGSGVSSHPNCSGEVKYSPSDVSYSLSLDNTMVVPLTFTDGCGNRICKVELVNVEGAGSWLRADSAEDPNGCGFVNLTFNATGTTGVHSATLEVKATLDNNSTKTLSIPVHLTVLPASQGALYMEPEKFYYVDIPKHSVYHAYFYGCSGPGGPRNEIAFSVEESSYYGSGAIEPIVKFVGSRPPTSSDFPTWDDYYTLASYVFTNTNGPREGWSANPRVQLCPRDYLESWSTWYGKSHPDYSDYYYCFGLVLTRYLWIYTPEGQDKCGWWAVTLFNNTNSDRESVRLWVEVKPYNK